MGKSKKNKRFTFEDDPTLFMCSQIPKDMHISQCAVCLNRLPNGECEEHSLAEVSAYISSNNCEEYIRDPRIKLKDGIKVVGE